MHLSRIRLLNWKTYFGEHDIRLPDPRRQQNVVLIGAPNGYGKTSLLEALILGLYGRDGMRLVARADVSGITEERRNQSYRQFLQSALNWTAKDEQTLEMRVEITFADRDGGDGCSISRQWTFTPAGLLSAEGERLVVTQKGKQVQPPKSASDDRDEYFRGWIARNVLPTHLAEFFLFDGERVQKLAEREMATQVRQGIEGFLGVHLLRDLSRDLQTYASRKRSSVQSVDSETLRALNEEVAKADTRIQDASARFEAYTQGAHAARQQSEDLQAQLNRMGGGSVSDVTRLVEEREGVKRSIESLTEQLVEIMSGDLALALSGPALRGQLMGRLQGEQKLADSRAAIEAASGRIDRFLAALMASPPEFKPSLSPEQASTLSEKVRGAWHSIWHPPDEGCAENFRHEALSDLDRTDVRNRLGRVSRLGEEILGDIIHKISDLRDQQTRLDRQINAFSGIKETLGVLVAKLEQALAETARLELLMSTTERELQAIKTERQQSYARLVAEEKRLNENEPHLRKIQASERIRDLIEPFIAEATAECVDEIAATMTDCFNALAHKSIVKEIKIDPDCNVRLLNRRGDDLRVLDASAGENQLFAFALISALHKAATVRFPLVVDTPLARLDMKHRTNVLRHFSEAETDQVIFLSQDAEISGDLKKSIDGRIRKTFLIEHDSTDKSRIGHARVVADRYFE